MVTKNKFDRLNLLRLLAFLLVFLRHAKFFMPVHWDANVPWAWLLYTPAAAGVWIFFVLSGYGIGHGFYTGKYELSAKGIVKFYLSRLVKIVPIYWIYLLFVIVCIKPSYLTPDWNGIIQLLKLFFFFYQEEFSYLEFGLAWFLTTLIRLYLIAPLGYWIINRYFSGKKQVFLWGMVVVGGMLLRIFMGYHIATNHSGTWSQNIYKPFFFNMDLFFGGFILNGIKIKKEKFRTIPGILWGILLLLIIYSCRVGYFETGYITNWLNVYEYILPSAFLIVTVLFIYNYEILKTYQQEKLTKESLKNNKWRVVDLVAKLVMPLYLFHSTILNMLKNGYSEAWYMKFVALFNIPLKYTDFSIGIMFTLVALFYTVLFAVGVKCWLEPPIQNVFHVIANKMELMVKIKNR